MKNIEDYFIEKTNTVRQAMELLNTPKQVLFVMDNKRLVGSLTDGDIRRWILSGGSLDEEASKAMNLNPHYVKEGKSITAKALMDKLGLLAVPVVNTKKEIVEIIFKNEKIKAQKDKQLNLPVIIMSGGKGERLLPFTSVLPKPLIPIGNKTIAERIVESFLKDGCKEFYFTLNYKKNIIKAYFDDLEKEYIVNYVEENEPLGTGGSLYYIKDLVKNTFFVSNCDILLDIDYESVYRFHKEQGNSLTMITSMKKYVLPYGVVTLNNKGYVKELVEKPANEYLVNTGVYMLEPEVLNLVGKEEFLHITHLIDKCMKNNMQIGAYPISEEAWMDMGQLEDLESVMRKFNG